MVAEWLSRPTVKPGNRFGRLEVRGFDPLHGRVECNTSIAAESAELSWIAGVVYLRHAKNLRIVHACVS